MNITKLTGPGDDEPFDTTVECTICGLLMLEDDMADGYIFPVCDECHEELSKPKEEETT